MGKDVSVDAHLAALREHPEDWGRRDVVIRLLRAAGEHERADLHEQIKLLMQTERKRQEAAAKAAAEAWQLEQEAQRRAYEARPDVVFRREEDAAAEAVRLRMAHPPVCDGCSVILHADDDGLCEDCYLTEYGLEDYIAHYGHPPR